MRFRKLLYPLAVFALILNYYPGSASAGDWSIRIGNTSPRTFYHYRDYPSSTRFSYGPVTSFHNSYGPVTSWGNARFSNRGLYINNRDFHRDFYPREPRALTPSIQIKRQNDYLRGYRQGFRDGYRHSR